MYLNLLQIAESFGVSEKVVEGWIRNEGLPPTPDRGRLLFDRAQVAQWAAARGLTTQSGFLAMEAPPFATGIRLAALLRAGGIWRDALAAELPAILDRIVASLPAATPPVRQLLFRRLRTRGGLTLAPIGGGFALPHPAARIALGRDSGTLALILLREAMPLEDPAPDGVAVTRLLFFIAPSPRTHLDILGQLSRLLSRGPLRDLVKEAADDDVIFRELARSDAVGVERANRERNR